MCSQRLGIILHGGLDSCGNLGARSIGEADIQGATVIVRQTLDNTQKADSLSIPFRQLHCLVNGLQHIRLDQISLS